MITKIKESDYGLDLMITPETPAEVAQLLRFSNNAKKQAARVCFSFHSDDPYCNISLRKISKKQQQNSIYK